MLPRYQSFDGVWVRMQMDQDSRASADDVAGPNDLLIGAFIVAIALLAFQIGYWGGRDIGSVLFG